MSAIAPTKPTKPASSTTATATWYVQYQANDVYWRCEAPASAVGGRVAKLYERTLDRAVTTPNRDTGIPWRAVFDTEDGPRVAATKKQWNELAKARLQYTSLDVDFPAHEGVAVWTRPCGRRAILAQSMRAQGILTVAETDDNYFADKHFNLHQRQVGWNDEAKEVVCRAMASMDRNVFSTPWLRDRYQKEYRARLPREYRQHLPEMFVCRNNIPRADWPERDPGDGQVRVGFMGSGSHVWDINMAYAAVHAAKTYGDATTTMIGYNPGNPDKEPDEITVDGEVIQLRSEKSKRYRDKWAAVVDTHIPWVDPGVYRRAALPLDVGLAPLARADDFTLGKSDAKAIEYTISGAACVVSGAGIYTSAGWKHEVNCLVATSWREMADATLRLCRDPGLRYELVTAAQEMVASERNEEALRAEWGAALAN